jgi:hypothetical protein
MTKKSKGVTIAPLDYQFMIMSDTNIKTIRKISKIIYSEVYHNCQVRTGYMRSTIKVVNLNKRGFNIVIECYYAGFYEGRYNPGWFASACENGIRKAQTKYKGVMIYGNTVKYQ